MKDIININGKFYRADTAKISIFDHGFLFGDSVYEVWKAYKGKIFTMDEHIERLYYSAENISFPIPFSPIFIKERIMEVASHAKTNKDLYIRLIITRGMGEIDIDPSTCKKPTFITIVRELKEYPREYYTKGVNVTLLGSSCQYKEGLNVGLKTGNYLNSVVAIIESNRVKTIEAIRVNNNGFITEGTTTNFFTVKDGVVYTSPLAIGILRGITREVVLKVAKRNNIPLREESIRPRDVKDADEVFITSTTKEVMPVRRVNNWKIGNGTPGVITKRLHRLFLQYVKESLNLPADETISQIVA